MENRGLRLARGEFPRATVQAAVLMAGLMGRDAASAPIVRSWATQTILGVLRSSILDLNIIHTDGDKAGVREAVDSFETWRQSPERVELRALTDKIGGMSLDVVLAAVDGAAALNEGRAGTTSVIAGAPPGAFTENRFKDNFGNKNPSAPGVAPGDCYLVVSVGSRVLSTKMCERIKKWKETCKGHVVADDDTPLTDFVADFGLLREIATVLNEEQNRPVIGMTLEGSNFRSWSNPIFPEPCMRRRLEGSAVVACVASMLGKVSATVANARRAQVIQMAVAVRSLGGMLFAVPLNEKPAGKNPSIKKVSVPNGAVFRQEDEFVTDSNALLSLSSITEICILDRTRFRKPRRAVVETMTLSVASHGISRTRHDIDLGVDGATFCMPDGTLAPAPVVSAAFEEVVSAQKRRKKVQVTISPTTRIHAPAKTS